MFFVRRLNSARARTDAAAVIQSGRRRIEIAYETPPPALLPAPMISGVQCADRQTDRPTDRRASNLFVGVTVAVTVLSLLEVEFSVRFCIVDPRTGRSTEYINGADQLET